MNCPQCQAANGADAAFCGICGARLTPAGAPAGASGYTSSPDAPLGYDASGASAGYGAPAGYDASSGYGAPAGYDASSGDGAPAGYGASGGYGAPSGFGAPAGYNAPPSSGYGPAGGQASTGYPQDQDARQYQQGTSGPSVQRSSGLPPVSFDLARLTKVDKIVAGATLITMISLWLPWYSGSYSIPGQMTSSGSISGTGDHGWLWLEFILALVLLAYLAARAAWDEFPFSVPVAHTPLLIGGTGLQFLLILIGFFALPPTDGIPGLSVTWDFGAFLALIASIVAVGPVVYPSVKSYLDTRNAGASRGL
jgi:hypothetical protein